MSIQHDRGRRAERATAKALGGRRVGNTGKATSDVVADDWSVEVKARRNLPAWLLDAMTQSERAAAAFTTPKTPLVVLHGHGMEHAQDLVVLRLYEWRALHGGWRGSSEGDS